MKFKLDAQARMIALAPDANMTVEQEWGKAKDISYPLKTCLSGYIYQNDISEKNVSIIIHGVPLSAIYRKGVSRYRFYTGAKISGEIRINEMGYPFSFEKEPSVSKKGFGGRDDPEDAPFPVVIRNDLFPLFTKLVRQETGKDVPEEVE